MRMPRYERHDTQDRTPLTIWKGGRRLVTGTEGQARRGKGR
jgi:hypothetical protein